VKALNMKILTTFFLLIFMAFCLFYPETPFTPEGDSNINRADTAWMLTATGLVLFMTPGLSFFYGGMVGTRNIISTMLQSFVCMGLVSLLWVVFVFSLCFGESLGGIIGDPRTFFMFQGVTGASHPELSPTIPLALFAMFQMKFCIIAPALITGSFAERVKFSSYVLFVCLFTIFIYAPLAHMTWHPDGLLHKMGVLDFAGGTVVHMSAGIAALVGAIFLGRRRCHISKEPHRPANIPYVILGTGMLWFGWFGFNAGSTLEASDQAVLAFATTNTASASAMLMWMLMDVMRGNKPSALGACIGAVVGLVAITPAAGLVSIPHSLFIGAMASVISHLAVHLKTKSQLDDTLDVFPCHGVGGITGMIFTGIFAKEKGLFFGTTDTFFAHFVALVGVAVFCVVVSYALYVVTAKLIPIRVNAEEESMGLDLSQHDEAIENGSSLGTHILAPQPAFAAFADLKTR
jgi:ammonium transporter, Amt family